MKIKFKQHSDRLVLITNEQGKEIGRIFAPAGTSEDRLNSIQVCGFSELYDYWGCGVFSDGKDNAKRDVQLWFDDDSRNEIISLDLNKTCMRCYYPKKNCQCNKFKIGKRYEQILKEKMVDKINKSIHRGK